MIRVESVKIERFRGIREGEVTGLADVSILVGRNNSGKTTVVEAISRALAWTAPDRNDVLGRENLNFWMNTRKQSAAIVAELWHRMENTRPVSIQAKVANITHILNLFWQLPSRQFTHSHEPSNPVPAITDFAARITAFRPPDGTNELVERQLWNLLLSRRADKSVVAAANEIFATGVEQISLPPDGRMMLLFADHGLALDVQGDGARAAIRCLLVLAALKGTALILEEPETHQHPGSLERFALALCKQARRQEVQLLITTHSVECVRAFMKAASTAGSEGAVFHLKLQDGALESRRLDAATVEGLLETGVDVRCLDLYA